MVRRAQSSWTRIKQNNFSHHADKRIYITTPIFYVNGAPHIGHLYSAVLADTIARFNSMLGHSVYLSTGTDEHGKKVQKAAEQANLPIVKYCDQISHQFREMCDTFQNSLEKNGHIYLGKYVGWYNETQEAFVLTKEVFKQDPVTNDPIEKPAESQDIIEWMEEDSYKFRLTSFADDLTYWLKNENVIQPAIYRNVLYSYLDELQDLSISRSVKRVPWAIPTPHDKSHTIYVWFDALVSYLTSMGYPDDSFKELRPPTIQIIGKDILRFHGIYWPAFLMAVGLEPPKQLVCHGHWTVNNNKMSKSKGNVISPFAVANDVTPDGLRYFLMRQGVVDSDSNYNPSIVPEIINADLADTFGNLVNRCFGKSINPKGIIPDPVECISILKSEVAVKNIKLLEEVSEKSEKLYETYRVHHVVERAMEVLHIANQMLNYHKPWILNKSKDLDSAKEQEATISLALESVRVVALILYPIIPNLTSNLLDVLQIPIENRTWEDTKPLHLRSASNGEKHVSENVLFFKKIKI